MARKLKGFGITMDAVDALSEFCKRVTLSPEVFPEAVRVAVFGHVHAAINTLTASEGRRQAGSSKDTSA